MYSSDLKHFMEQQNCPSAEGMGTHKVLYPHSELFELYVKDAWYMLYGSVKGPYESGFI